MRGSRRGACAPCGCESFGDIAYVGWLVALPAHRFRRKERAVSLDQQPVIRHLTGRCPQLIAAAECHDAAETNVKAEVNQLVGTKGFAELNHCFHYLGQHVTLLAIHDVLLFWR